MQWDLPAFWAMEAPWPPQSSLALLRGMGILPMSFSRATPTAGATCTAHRRLEEGPARGGTEAEVLRHSMQCHLLTQGGQVSYAIKAQTFVHSLAAYFAT